jgi:hypothetical protein
MQRFCALLFAALSISLFSVQPTAAQSPGPGMTLGLVDQPLWHEPNSPLGLNIRIDNASAEAIRGFIVGVEAQPRMSSRSALHETFEGSAAFAVPAFSKYFPDRTVGSGSTTSIRLMEPISEIVGATAENGVYPVTISLFDASGGQLLGAVTTPLIYYASQPELPIGLVLTVPLAQTPVRAPSGDFSASAPGEPTNLELGLGEGRWLTELVNLLTEAATEPEPPEPEREPRRGRRRGNQRRADRPPPPPPPSALHLGVAPSPRLIEELADMASSYRVDDPDGDRTVGAASPQAQNARAALDAIRELMGLPTVQSLLLPYAFPDLPALTRNVTLEHGLIPQLGEARVILADELAREDDELAEKLDAAWLLPPAGRVDQSTLDLLQASFDHTFFSDDSFEELPDPALEGCPDPAPSFTCPVEIRDQDTETTGYITDRGLQERFAALAQPGEDRIDLQRFFAETAMIREEAPGLEGRVVHATLPSRWHPHPSLLRILLKGLREAPWLKTLRPDEGLEFGRPPEPRRLVQELAPLASEPDAAFYDSLEEAYKLVDSFELINPPTALQRRFVGNLLVAQSRVWSGDQTLVARGAEYLDQTLVEVTSEFAKITIGGIEEIRLTSHRGEIPIEVFNDAGYPVSVDIRLVAPELRMDRTLNQALPEHRFKQLTVDVTDRSRASGIFSLQVVVETPGGAHEIDQKLIRIRSTEFNIVALTITIGAFAFLVLFYLLRGFRRRERPGNR